MKKLEITTYLVKEWVKNSSTQQERKIKFINHDSIINKINNRWLKDYIEYKLNQYLNGKKYIETIISELLN